MSTRAYINPTTEQQVSKACSDLKHLRASIGKERIDNLKRMRDQYEAQYKAIDRQIREIAENKRLKNKAVSLELVASRARDYFNFRSLDFFLVRLGYIPTVPGAIYEGYEQAMKELLQQTQHTLMTYGKYAGFQDIYWGYCGGHERWKEDDEPDFPDKEDYIREEYGILYV